jgi:agmatinase
MDKMMKDPIWMQQVIETLGRDVYLTFDLDVLDPSIMPSTGTPEPGGMDWYTALGLIRKVVQQRNLVGFDIVELCPDTHNKAPDFSCGETAV